MNKILNDQIEWNIEIYVNDMIDKSKSKEEHAKDLQAVFKVLRNYNLELNLEKCVCGV